MLHDDGQKPILKQSIVDKLDSLNRAVAVVMASRGDLIIMDDLREVHQ